MLEWFVPENTWIASVLIVSTAVIIALLMRWKNIEFPRLDTKEKNQAQLSPQCSDIFLKKCRNHPQCPLAGGTLSHFLSNEQHQGQETNGIEPELNQERGDCQETIEQQQEHQKEIG